MNELISGVDVMILLAQIPSGISLYSHPVVVFNSLGELLMISFNGSVQYTIAVKYLILCKLIFVSLMFSMHCTLICITL